MAESPEITVALVQKDIGNIFTELKNINEKLDQKYVTKEELKTVADKTDFTQKIIFGFIAMIVIAVLGSLIYTVVIPKGNSASAQTSISNQ